LELKNRELESKVSELTKLLGGETQSRENANG